MVRPAQETPMKINSGGSRQQVGLFSEDVEVDVASLTLVGVNVAQYVPNRMCYDSNSFVATWTFPVRLAS